MRGHAPVGALSVAPFTTVPMTPWSFRRGRLALEVCAVLVAASAPVVAQSPSRLVEEHRFGGAAEGPASFSNIRGLAVTPGGRVFVVDVGPRYQIRLFDWNGRFLRDVGRSGGGPGEYQVVSAILAGQDGNVHVVDPFGMRVLAFNADGDLVRQRTIQFPVLTRTWNGAIASDGVLLDPVPGGPPAGAEQRQPGPRLRRIRPDGTAADTIPFPGCDPRQLPPARGIQFVEGDRRTFVQVPFLPTPTTVFATDGTAWCSPRDEYVIVRLRVGTNDTLNSIRRDIRPLPIDPDTLAKLRRGFAGAAARAASTNYRPELIPDVQPVIAEIRLDDRNRLWVRGTDTPRQAPAYDVFDSNGTAVLRVQSTVAFVGIPVVVGDAAFGVVLDADDVPFIVRAVLRP